MRNKSVLLALLSIMLAALLAGCMGNIALTPEDAVMGTFAKNLPPAGINIDPNSLQVLQSQQAGDNYLVLVNFQGTDAQNGAQTCLYTYKATRSMGGWINSGGEGSCGAPPANPSAQALTLALATGKDGQNDPGYSSIGGQVWLKYVKVVQVTWSDGKVEQLAIDNNSFFSVRSGQVACTRVDALNVMNQILYTYIPPAPAQAK